MELVLAPDGTPVEQGTYDFKLMRMFDNFIATASPEIRAAIKKRLEDAITRFELPSETLGCADWRNTVDLGDKWQGWGPNSLYVWLDGDGIPFYAGQAVAVSRPGQFRYKERSEEFKDVIRRGGCHSVVVAKHIPSTKIDDLEQGLIAYLGWKEYPIVNKRKLPSNMEIGLAKRIAKAGNLSIESVFLSQTEYESEFRAIFSVLDKVVGKKWDGECAVLSDQ